jgi:hypothetical protein
MKSKPPATVFLPFLNLMRALGLLPFVSINEPKNLLAGSYISISLNSAIHLVAIILSIVSFHNLIIELFSDMNDHRVMKTNILVVFIIFLNIPLNISITLFASRSCGILSDILKSLGRCETFTLINKNRLVRLSAFYVLRIILSCVIILIQRRGSFSTISLQDVSLLTTFWINATSNLIVIIAIHISNHLYRINEGLLSCRKKFMKEKGAMYLLDYVIKLKDSFEQIMRIQQIISKQFEFFLACLLMKCCLSLVMPAVFLIENFSIQFIITSTGIYLSVMEELLALFFLCWSCGKVKIEVKYV